MSNKIKPRLPELIKNESTFDSLRLAVCDLNGILRGKRFPAEGIEKLIKNGSRMPLSTSCIDIWGTDLSDSPFLFDTGDADGIVTPISTELIPINWLERSTALLLGWMSNDQNKPSLIDPRQILRGVLENYSVLGLTPIIAFELEFYLLDIKRQKPIVSKNPITKTRLLNTSVLSVDELDSFEAFFLGPLYSSKLPWLLDQSPPRGSCEVRRTLSDVIFLRGIRI